MHRDLSTLTQDEYDLLVIGGGIFGAWTLWDASLRGLSAVLVDRGDFGAATSANSMRIIHGGLRDLARADFAKMRIAQRERATLLRIAPEFVRPLPMVIPSYGFRSAALRVGMGAYQLFNSGQDFRDYPPEVLTRAQMADRFPGLDVHGPTGGVIFNDAQVVRPERFLISMLASASGLGAQLANYAEVTALRASAGRVCGADIVDCLSGKRHSVRAKAIINAAGPWWQTVLASAGRDVSRSKVRYAKGMNLITRQLDPKISVGVLSRGGTDLLNGKGRYLFATPWHARSLVGTAYFEHRGNADSAHAIEEEIQAFLDQVNRSYPAASLRRQDVEGVHVGMVPIRPDGEKVRLRLRDRVIDHEGQGLVGLISIASAKYSTARLTAKKAVNRACKHLGALPRPSQTALAPIRDLARPNLENAHGLRAATIYAVRNEMAQSLEDVVYRRIGLGSIDTLDLEDLRVCAASFGQESGSNLSQTDAVLASMTAGIKAT